MNIFRELLDLGKHDVFWNIDDSEFWTGLNCNDVVPCCADARTIFDKGYYGDDEVEFQKHIEYGITFTKLVLSELKEDLDFFYKKENYNLKTLEKIEDKIKVLWKSYERKNKLDRICE